MNKFIKSLFLMIPIGIVSSQNIVSYANDNSKLIIKETNNNSNQTTLTVDNDDFKQIRLPDGNWVKGGHAKFTVTKNGNYDFLGITNDGNYISNSFAVTNLKNDLLTTGSTNVKLALSSTDTLSGVESMCFKNDGDKDWSKYEPYNNSKDWTLKDGDGIKTVFAKFKDKAGNESVEVFDNIYLDKKGPDIQRVLINRGEEWSKSSSVTVDVYASDNRSNISYFLLKSDESNDWIRIDNTNNNQHYFDGSRHQFIWKFKNIMNSNHSISIKAVDEFGNIGNIGSDSIKIDTMPPFCSISINNGASKIASKKVNLDISYEDWGGAISSIEIVENDKTYKLPNVKETGDKLTIPWTLSTGNKAQVKIVATDKAGNVATAYSNVVDLFNLNVSYFKLTNVVNPKYPNFKPLTWSFAPQKMVSGGNISFNLGYSFDVDSSIKAILNGDYTIEVIGDNNYHKVINTKFDSVKNNEFIGTVTLPNDAPNGSKVYISSKIEGQYSDGGDTYRQEAFFPAKNEKALIGTIEKNINNDIIFNQTV